MELAFFKDKNIFVTGHTGFKGAWLCKILIDAGANVTGYALEPLTEFNLFTIAGISHQMTSVIGDVRDYVHLKSAFDKARPEIVLHLAAQPLVKESYRTPRSTFETNVMGTVNLLECIRTASHPVKSVLNVTTDKVYQNKEWCWGYREDEKLDGFDPYSNSKSCSELITHSYYHSFFQDNGVPISTARAGNVIGGGDFAEDRIIPDCIRAARENKLIKVRNAYSVRPYQHVLEPLMAYLMIVEEQYKNPEKSGWYNVGPNEEDCVATGCLVQLFCDEWSSELKWENCTQKNAPHEATFLKLDCSKIKTTFGWRQKWFIEKAIRETINWTTVWMNSGDVKREMSRQVEEFLEG